MILDFLKVVTKEYEESKPSEKIAGKVLPKIIKETVLYNPRRIEFSLEYMGEFTGIKAILPINKNDIGSINKIMLKRYFKYMEEHFSIPEEAIWFDRYICDALKIDDKRALENLNLRMLIKVIELLRRQRKISKKKIRVMLIDDGNAESQYILEELVKNYNHLFLVSDNLNKWEDVIKDMFDETGMVIYQYDNPISEDINVDVVINMSDSGYENMLFINNADVFDMKYNIEEIKRIVSINSKLNIYHSLMFKSINRPIDSELTALILEDKMKRENIGLEELFSAYSIEFEGVS